jgi:hypothetical protein
MKYTSRNPNGINQIASSSVAITVLNNDVAVFTTSSLNLSGSLTASSALITGNVTVLGTASINTLIVNQTQLSTGSNQLGDAVDDFQTLYGTVRIPTGSLTVSGSITATRASGTGYVLDIPSGDIRIQGSKLLTSNNNNELYLGFGKVYMVASSFVQIGNATSTTSRVSIRGLGATSSTNALLVENSNASASLIIRDDQTIILTGAVQTTGSISISGSLLIGENSSSLYTSRTTIINSGSTDLYSIPTSSYDAVYFDYVIKSGSNARAGQVFSTYITTASTYIDNSTSDIGNTSVFYFSSSISSSNLVLHGSTTSDGWKVKTIIRGL